MIKAALQQLLWNTPRVAVRLGQWDFGDGVMRPCIFTNDPAPEAAPNNIIVINQTGGTPWAQSRGDMGGQIFFQFSVWGDNDTSDRDLRALAMEVYQALNLCELNVSGYQVWAGLCSIPQETHDKDNYSGYIMTLDVKFKKG
jgi:hypothetical protein